MTENDKPVSNPMVLLREEFDDCAILFDSDTGKAFGLNPVSVLVWKLLDGTNTLEDIHKKLNEQCTNVSDEVKDHVRNFIEELLEKGLAGYEDREVRLP